MQRKCEGCNATLRAKCVIVSTGVEYRQINAEGREDFEGAGVSIKVRTGEWLRIDGRMKSETVSSSIDRQQWLAQADNALTQVADTVTSPGPAWKDFLHGKWLGHPFHAAITDVPIGAWTASTVLDLNELVTGKGSLSPGADAVVGIGAVAAVGAALAGIADWRPTPRPARRVGALHALVNSAALVCYVSSLWLRRNRQRQAGIALGLAGFALVATGAWLGGHLVYDEGIGVDHGQPGNKVKDWMPVMPSSELHEGEPKRVDVAGIRILFVRNQSGIFAIGERCSHLGGPLAEGLLENGTIRCPWHGSRFSIQDGSVVEGPAAFDQACFETRERGGSIEVRSREATTARRTREESMAPRS